MANEMAAAERESVQEQIRRQGDVVRQMKKDSKPQEEVSLSC